MKKNIWAGLDVYNDECATATGTMDTPLSMHPHVYGTHHIGASTEQAQNAIAAEVIEILKNYEQGVVLHPVNMEMKPVVKHTIIMRVFDRVGVLASVLLLLKEQGVNLQQLESRVFCGGNAQQIILHISKRPDDKTIEKIRCIDNIIQVDVNSCVEKEN